MFPPWSDIYSAAPRGWSADTKNEKNAVQAWSSHAKKRPSIQKTGAAGSTNEQSFICSAVSIWRLFHPCQPLFTSFFKILGKAKPQLYRRKAAIPTREISRRFPADRLQLADPTGPCSFAPPACAGFAELNSYFTDIEYTQMNILSSRKYAKSARLSAPRAFSLKLLQILHRAGNIPVLRHIQVRINLHCRSDAEMADTL